MKKVKIGILGCGLVSDLYLPVFRHIPEVELAAVADVNTDSVKEVAKRYNVKRIYSGGKSDIPPLCQRGPKVSH